MKSTDAESGISIRFIREFKPEDSKLLPSIPFDLALASFASVKAIHPDITFEEHLAWWSSFVVSQRAAVH